jgi:hypothetical protein
MSQLHRVGPNRAARRSQEFGGKSAEEAWAQGAFPKGAQCLGCSRVPVASLTSFVPVDDMAKVDPLWALWPEHHKHALTVEFTYGRFVRWREVYACTGCLHTAEKAAAKLPSWVQTEVRRCPAQRVVSGATSHGGGA